MNSPASALLQKIKLSMRKKIHSQFIGQYHSVFKGNGLSFDNVREYQFGDDVRNIDWNVSARMDHLYIKEYIEERELSIVLMIDLSASMAFGSVRSKKDVLLEIAALFLYLAQQNNDKISVLLFTDEVEWYFTPKKGRKYVLKVLNDIVSYEPKKRKTDIQNAIAYLQRVQKKRSVVIVLSDFLDEGYLLQLKRLRRKHDVILVLISDPIERKAKFFGLTQFTDLETGSTIYADSIPVERKLQQIQGFNVLRIATDENIENVLLKYFQKRNKEKQSRW
jgi:uncharacterized protein (DUF58 family)